MHSFFSILQVLHDIYLVFTYSASFTDYEDDIFDVISNLHVQESKFGGKFFKFWGKSLRSSWSAFFPGLHLTKFSFFLFCLKF